MKINATFSLLFLLMVPPAEASDLVGKARELNLAQDIGWIKLLHYKKGLFGGYTSQVDGATFFLAQDGKTDPDAELQATIKSWFDTPDTTIEQEHPRCRFPARTLWLTRNLGISESELPKVSCPGYEQFKERLSAQGASLIFSSFYLNNPSSTFGHSFLRIKGGKSTGTDGRHHELLDHGINFAAEMTTSNPVLYAIFGLTGVFRGTFTSLPYYYKVREYNDFESRDIWSYDLNLTPGEIELLVAHIWEMGSTYYDYFYFTENCSYHIFTTLEAAAPRLTLTQRLPFYVIPSDTVRVLIKEPDFVTKISYRPSVHSQFMQLVSQLSPEEKQALDSVISDTSVDAVVKSGLPTASQAKVLDASLDYLEFRHPMDLVKTDTDSARWKQKLLAARAHLGVASEELDRTPPPEKMPHLAHPSGRLALESGYEQGLGPNLGASVRFALNDALDPSQGYPKNSQIEFMHVRMRYNPTPSTFELGELTLFRVTSLSPHDFYTRAVSFRVELGIKQIYDRNCDRCLAGLFEVGPGLATDLLGAGNLLAYAILNFQGAYSPSFSGSNGRIGVGPQTGLILHFSDRLKTALTASYQYSVFAIEPHSYEFGNEWRWSFAKDWALNAKTAMRIPSWEARGGVMYYF